MLPSLRENVFLPRDSVLCAHLDLELNLSDTAENYHFYWLDRDSIELPYGHDTTRYTVEGMRGTDGFEWNGRVNNTGVRLPDGPYFYMVTYKNLYGKRKVQSGSITILGTSE